MTPLRQQMIATLELRGLSPKSVRLYVDHVARFARHFHRSPAALGRDARLLSEAGYELQTSELIDLFPHTSHVEVVSRFDRA